MCKTSLPLYTVLVITLGSFPRNLDHKFVFLCVHYTFQFDGKIIDTASGKVHRLCLHHFQYP